MYKTIGLLAHVDAGKTTFAEQLLYHTSSIRSRGRVDHKDAFLDSHELERARGITIFADQAVMRCGQSEYVIMDTPGHVDFSAEMERALQAMDYAVIIISAVEGIESHTETVWGLLRKRRIPTLFFINKVDREGADPAAVLGQIRKTLTPDAIDLFGNLADGVPEAVLAFAAERDDALLESYLEGNTTNESAIHSIFQSMQRGNLFPVMSGSALLDRGIAEFIANMELLTLTEYAAKRENRFAARVYKIRHELQGTRLTFVKLLQGKLNVRDEIEFIDNRGEKRSEKVTSIRIYSGEKFSSIDYAEAGQLVALTGISAAAPGDGLGDMQHERSVYELVPALKAKVFVDPAVSVKEANRCFRLLEAEDPSLGVVWDEALQELLVHVMGAIQLEVLEQIVSSRFGFSATFGAPEILYKETIMSPTYGYGHFEPLGHYAEVHLKLEPGPRNSGITFKNECHVDDLNIGYQHLIEQHLMEKDHRGLLTGSPIADIVVTLITGRAHNKHTSGGDFREAALRALRQGLEKADNRLLEPFYAYQIKVHTEQIGKVLADIQFARGTMEPPEMDGEFAVVRGEAPVAAMMAYSAELAAYTKGKGSISLTFSGYQLCQPFEAVIAEKKYDKNADPGYTSTSIFCAKGKGFSVRWDEAEALMHAEIINNG
ncbi:GTP-binding protein [Paenibacillus sp. NEAU-GSW1]|nr:GTP-binding protein [Paenibacillus sp. NEAU-GSW1]